MANNLAKIAAYRSAIREANNSLLSKRNLGKALCDLTLVSNKLLMDFDVADSELLYREYRIIMLEAENRFMLKLINQHMSQVSDFFSSDTISP